MDINELKLTLRKEEGLKLDFKREYKISPILPVGGNKQLWASLAKSQWDEFIKDVIALTNGNVGASDQVALLIIGADDTIESDGSRLLYDMRGLQLDAQKVMSRVNAVCDPPIPNMYCELIEVEGKGVYVISIPPTPYVHETNRQLNIQKGIFDSSGTLIKVEPDKTYTQYTAFIRKGEDISPASMNERRALESDKKFDILIMNSNIRSELISNLSILLIKSKGKLFNPVIFYRSFRDNYNLVFNQDLIVEGKYIKRLVTSILYTYGSKRISTRFIEQAILSSKYISYNPMTRSLDKSKILNAIDELHENTINFRRVVDHPSIDNFVAKHSTKYDGKEKIRIPLLEIIFVVTMLDRFENIVNLSIAMVKYLMGEDSALDEIKLNPSTPIESEVNIMNEEKISHDDVLAWILKE